MQASESFTFDGGYYDVVSRPPVIYLGEGPGGEQAVVAWEGADQYSFVAAVGRGVAASSGRSRQMQDAQAHARVLARRLEPRA